jgi:hypothetical protein
LSGDLITDPVSQRNVFATFLRQYTHELLERFERFAQVEVEFKIRDTLKVFGQLSAAINPIGVSVPVMRGA